MTEEEKKLLEEIRRMQKEMNELENELTDEERHALIYDMDDRHFEL